MIHPLLVEIAAKRIMNGGLNPKTKEVYTLDDITNEEFKALVIEYIKNNS